MDNPKPVQVRFSLKWPTPGKLLQALREEVIRGGLVPVTLDEVREDIGSIERTLNLTLFSVSEGRDDLRNSPVVNFEGSYRTYAVHGWCNEKTRRGLLILTTASSPHFPTPAS